MTEPLNSSSLGAMESLLRKLNELLRTEERAQGLIGDLRIIRTKMEELSKVHSPPNTMKYWMNDARELSYDMEVCVDRFIHASQPEDLPAKLAWIFTWHKEILGFAARVKEVNERCERYNLVSSCSPTKIIARHQLQTLYKEPDPVGMEEPTSKLLEWLMPKDHGEDEDKLNVVSILGDGGVGKSMLVKRLWRMSEDNKFQFNCRAFVQTAKKPDTRMILRSIISQVQPKEPPKCSSKVPNLIHDLKELLRDKRYFIVIDDLWDISVWHIVKRAFPPDGNCRIVTTTTAENIAQACCSYDRDNIVNVKCLHDDQAKKLFVDRAFGTEKGCPIQFNDITDEITEKCGGLPLAIICTARLVANQPEKEQGQQLDYVNYVLPNKLRTQSSSTEILAEVLNLCYSGVPFSLRTCLLYLSMYPESYLFLKEDLVKQWMAEDFICAPYGNDIADVAGGYFDELVSLGMVQRMDMINSNKKGLLSYAVHPAVFDFIRCKSMEDNFITAIDYSQSTAVLTEKVRRLSLHFGSATYATTPACVELSQVRSLSFTGLLGCMPSVAEFMLVRVVILHIHSDDGDKKFSLAEICKLLQLRYLQVRTNVTVELPDQMQCLKHLETLEINAGVEYVPSDIVRLSGLLHVRLGRKGSQTPTLSLVDWSRVPSPPVFLESFELLPPICIFSRLPLWIHELHKLRILEIVVRESRELRNSIEALEQLPVLKHLSLYVRTPIEGTIIFRKDMFPALEYLKFVCGVLSLIFREETLPNLRKLKLVFNAHKGGQYSNMVVGISHLLSLQKVVAAIGLAPDAEESDRIAAESALYSAIRKHPAGQRSFKVSKKVDLLDEDDDPSMKLSGISKTGERGGQVRMWKLTFLRPPRLPIYTDSDIVDHHGRPLEVILVDLETGSQLNLSGSIQVVPLAGDFPDYNRKHWTADEFETAVIVRERPLLVGDVRLTMLNGRATAGELKFTDNSPWIRCRKFRIGARVVPGSYDDGGRIVEAITEAFVVKDRRAEGYEKHYPPVLGDPVWRLRKITKEGAFHRRLKSNNIETVQEFLRMLTVKPDELRVILGDGITNYKWEAMTRHARTFLSDDKVYVHRRALGGTIYVNSVLDLVAFEMGGIEYPRRRLDTDRRFVQELTLEAYEHRHNLQLLQRQASDHHKSFLPSNAISSSAECQVVSSEPSMTTLTSVLLPPLQASMYPHQASSSSSLGHSFEDTKAWTTEADDPNEDLDEFHVMPNFEASS